MPSLQGLLEYLRSLYSESIPHHDRDPVLTIPVGDYGSLGLLLPKSLFWIQTTSMLAIVGVINASIACMIYKLIIKQRPPKSASGAVATSTASYLLGYGIICPVVAMIPFYLARWLHVHTLSALIAISGTLVLTFFKTLMAVHGTVPEHAERSLGNFLFYFCLPMQFRYDAQTGDIIPSSRQEMRQKATTALECMSLVCLVLGIMSHYDYEFFPRRKKIRSLVDLFFWGNILNNYAMAYLTAGCLEAGMRCMGVIVEVLTGKSVVPLSDRPLTASSSASDFWGRRWNTLVHVVLKGGVYLPMISSGFSKALASFSAFVASGLLHEYILLVFTMRGVLQDDETAYTPQYGYHIAFFAWNAVVLIIESLVYKHHFVQQLKATLPKPVITALVIMTVLPIGHFFTDEYVELGFYDDFAVGMPILVWS